MTDLLVRLGKSRTKQQGVTFLELIIVMVIIGILSVIAYPSYRSYILKARRSDAMTMLTQDQLMLERCYAQNFSYNATCASLPSFPQTSAQGYYSIALSNLSATTYTLTATPVGTQALDTGCASMAVNQANVKTASDSTGTATSSCWGG